MGHHGWNGDPPPTEELARERLVVAAAECVDRVGAVKTTLSDVAAEAGVTRQTVYRYFGGLGELLHAVAESGATAFVARMREHVGGRTVPGDALAEAVVFCVRELPREPRISALLDADDDLFGRGVTSAAGARLGVTFLHDLDVDWASAGIEEEGLEELAELTLRLVGSFMQYPPARPRGDDELRAFVRRWIGPQVGQQVEALD